MLIRYEGAATCLYRHSQLPRESISWVFLYRRDLVHLIWSILYLYWWNWETCSKFFSWRFLKNHFTLLSPTRCIFRCILVEVYPVSSLMTGAMFGSVNPLNTQLNPICYLLALLGAHHILYVSRIRVKAFTENWHIIQHFAALVIKRSKNWICEWCEHESFYFLLCLWFRAS